MRYRFGDDAVAEDLTATVFEKAWKGKHRYQNDLSAFSTWLFTIARNTATDHFRRNRHDLPLDALREQADSASLEEAVQRKQDFAYLDRLLSQLSVRDRELIALKYGADLTNREIARLTGLSESNIGTLLSRVIEKLRKKWM